MNLVERHIRLQISHISAPAQRQDRPKNFTKDVRTYYQVTGQIAINEHNGWLSGFQPRPISDKIFAKTQTQIWPHLSVHTPTA